MLYYAAKGCPATPLQPSQKCFRAGGLKAAGGRTERRTPMFQWLKRNEKDPAGQPRLPGPKNLPDDVGRTLVVDLKQEPNWVWTLKAVVKPEQEKGRFLVRVYDERTVASKGLRVTDYNSFTQNPEMILFEGWFNKKSHEAHISAYQKAA
jgi:hypothetical protein